MVSPPTASAPATARKNSVHCDPQKIIPLRANLAMTQEKLAQMSKVHPRTVQRAEAGHPINLETLADLAAALGVPAESILARKEPEEAGDTSDMWTNTTVRRVASGRELLENLRKARLGALEYEIEPTSQNLPVLKRTIEALQPHMPRHPLDMSEFRNAPFIPSLVDELEAIVGINSQLQELQDQELALFVGMQFLNAVMPCYDPEEDRFVFHNNQSPERVWAVRLLLAPNSVEKMKVKTERDWDVTILDEIDDDIPF